MFSIRDEDEKAMKDYDAAVIADPKNIVGHTGRASLYYKSGQYQKAVDEYSIAIDLIENKTIKSYYLAFRGESFIELGNYQKAIHDFNKAIELYPKNHVAYKGRGVVYIDKLNKQQAILDWKTAARLGNSQAQELLKSMNIKW